MFAATKAFVMHDGKVLVLRESNKYEDGSNCGSFDVVGGRVEPGQHFGESLIREIKEETGLDVEIGRPFFVNEWRPQVRGEQWHIVATFFVCHARSLNVILSEDHDQHLWINPVEYHDHPLIENLHPAFEAYLDIHK